MTLTSRLAAHATRARTRPPERAELLRGIRVEGARVCLYTDEANPASNKIYANLGYRPVAEMVNLVIID